MISLRRLFARVGSSRCIGYHLWPPFWWLYSFVTVIGRRCVCTLPLFASWISFLHLCAIYDWCDFGNPHRRKTRPEKQRPRTPRRPHNQRLRINPLHFLRRNSCLVDASMVFECVSAWELNVDDKIYLVAPSPSAKGARFEVPQISHTKDYHLYLIIPLLVSPVRSLKILPATTDSRHKVPQAVWKVFVTILNRGRLASKCITLLKSQLRFSACSLVISTLRPCW